MEVQRGAACHRRTARKQERSTGVSLLKIRRGDVDGGAGGGYEQKKNTRLDARAVYGPWPAAVRGRGAQISSKTVNKIY